MIKLEKIEEKISIGNSFNIDGENLLFSSNGIFKKIENEENIKITKISLGNDDFNIKEIKYFDYKFNFNGQDIFLMSDSENLFKNPIIFFFDKNENPFFGEEGESEYGGYSAQKINSLNLKKGFECKDFFIDENKKISGFSKFYGFRDNSFSCTQEEIKEKEPEKPKKPEIVNNDENGDSKIENQTFKDIEEKKFEFKIKEVQKGENTYILVDNSEFNNYIANKINEFTTFTYIGTFFIFTIFSFYFIKILLGK